MNWNPEKKRENPPPSGIFSPKGTQLTIKPFFFFFCLNCLICSLNPSKHVIAHAMKIEKSRFKEDKEFAQSYSAGKWGLTTIF